MRVTRRSAMRDVFLRDIVTPRRRPALHTLPPLPPLMILLLLPPF